MYRINMACEGIKKVFSDIPKTCVVLGSGFSGLAEHLQDYKEISYSQISGFPVSTVEGHSGKLLKGKIADKDVIMFSGRFHYYEGYSMTEIAFPIRTMKKLGVENLILTNASGGINESYTPGDLSLITDHIKFFDDSPLRGKNHENIGVRFPDMTYAYDKELMKIAKEAAKTTGVELKEGVYAFMSGPSFETKAEIKALRILGADMVGMSTVPENIAAVHAGLKVVAISCVCNMAAGILDKPLCHEEVLQAGKDSSEKSIKLLTEMIRNI